MYNIRRPARQNTWVFQMPTIKDHIDSSDADDESEAGRTPKKKQEKNPSMPGDTNPDISGTEVLEDERLMEKGLEKTESEDDEKGDEITPPGPLLGLDDFVDSDLDAIVTPKEHEIEDTDTMVESIGRKDESDVIEPRDRESYAYQGGTAGLYYLRGLLCHQRMNLDDAIRYLGKSLEISVELDLFDYVVKTQIQLASICLKRFRIHGDKQDYYSSLHYSENLIQIAKELELDELWTEALLLRAILRKIANDVYGARDDLNQARAMAKSTNQESVEILIERELEEVRRLVARASRRKHHEENNGESMMDEALEAIPGIFDESLKLEISRESLEISVELRRLVIMNLSSGLPLYTYSFDGAVDEKSELVYGFLSALSHLAAEIIDSPGMIRSITHEGSTVMMEHRGVYMAALFASREDFRARQSLQKFLREFLRLVPEMRVGEVVTEECRFVADEMLLRIFKAFL